MNSVLLIGRLTREPDVRYTAGTQMAVARFSIAIDSGFGDNKRTDFPSIVCFGKTAEICEKYLTKGSQVGITGRLQTSSYEKDGTKHYTTDVIADRVEFLQRAKEQSEAQAEPSPAEEYGGFTAIDEDVPF